MECSSSDHQVCQVVWAFAGEESFEGSSVGERLRFVAPTSAGDVSRDVSVPVGLDSSMLCRIKELKLGTWILKCRWGRTPVQLSSR